MRVFTKYFLKEFFPVFFASVLILIGLFLINDALQFIVSLFVKGAALLDIAEIFILGIPASFIFVIPVSFLMGWVVSVSRLAGDSEILALQSSGINPRAILKPVLATGFIVSLFLLYSNSVLSPKSSCRMNSALRKVLSKNILQLQEKTFSKIGDYVFFVDSIGKDRMEDIRIYKLKENFPEIQIFARDGIISGGREGITGLELEKGTMLLRDASSAGKLTTVKFDKYSFAIDSETDYKETHKITQIESSQLKKRIKELKNRGLPAGILEAEYNMRNSLAFSGFFLAILGVMAGIRVKSPRKVIGIGLSVFLVFLYYACFTLFLNLSENGWINSAAACWIPNLLCAAGAVLLK